MTAPCSGVTPAASGGSRQDAVLGVGEAVVERAAAGIDLRLDLQSDRAEVLDALVLQDLGVDGTVGGLEGTGAVDGVARDTAGGVAVELVPTERGLAGECERHVATEHLDGSLSHVAVEAGAGRRWTSAASGWWPERSTRKPRTVEEVRGVVPEVQMPTLLAFAAVPAVGARCTAWQTPHLAVDCE